MNEENLTEDLKNIFSSLGIKEHNKEPGMILRLDNYNLTTNELHNNIIIAHTTQHITDFAGAIAKNWTPTDQNVITYFEKTAPYYLSNTDAVFLAIYYQDNKAVSVLEMFCTDKKNVGLYGFATLKEYQGKGIGSALLTFALNKLKKSGFQNVMLQASEEGLGIYTKLGFEIITHYYEFA